MKLLSRHDQECPAKVKLTKPNHRSTGLRSSHLRPSGWVLVLISLLVGPTLGCHHRPAPPQPYLAFVVNSGSSTLALVDLARLRVTAAIPGTPQPDTVVARPDSHQL